MRKHERENPVLVLGSGIVVTAMVCVLLSGVVGCIGFISL